MASWWQLSDLGSLQHWHSQIAIGGHLSSFTMFQVHYLGVPNIWFWQSATNHPHSKADFFDDISTPRKSIQIPILVGSKSMKSTVLVGWIPWNAHSLNGWIPMKAPFQALMIQGSWCQRRLVELVKILQTTDLEHVYRTRKNVGHCPPDKNISIYKIL